MNVVPEYQVRNDEKQIGWFKSSPHIDPMPDISFVKKHGVIIQVGQGFSKEDAQVLSHPNFTPLKG